MHVEARVMPCLLYVKVSFSFHRPTADVPVTQGLLPLVQVTAVLGWEEDGPQLIIMCRSIVVITALAQPAVASVPPLSPRCSLSQTAPREGAWP